MCTQFDAILILFIVLTFSLCVAHSQLLTNLLKSASISQSQLPVPSQNQTAITVIILLQHTISREIQSAKGSHRTEG